MLARARWWCIAGAVLVLAASAQVGAADRIAYQGRLVMGTRGIVVMDANGDNPVQLPRVPGSDYITPALSPDGIVLAYAAEAAGHFKLWVVTLGPDNSPADEPRLLTVGDSDDEQPAWSRDGQRIAFVSVSGDQRALVVIPAQGGTPSAVATLGDDFRSACPHWSPDGSSIVFGRDGKLFIVEVESGSERELVADGMYPSWSPEGKEIAFFTRRPEPALTVISLESGETRTLVQKVEFFGETAWSPDGRYVAFKADQVGDAEGKLWVVSAAGGAVKPLRSYGVAHGYLDWSGKPLTVAAAPAAATAPTPPETATTTAESAGTAPKFRLTQPKPSTSPAPAQPRAPTKPVKPAEAPPQPPPVRIVSPAEGAVVRGMIKVTASKADRSGYVSFVVDGKFLSACIAPYEIDWDTRSSDDGPHTISVIGYGAAGERQGSAEVGVEVRNAIGAEMLPPEGVLLRFRFKPRQKWNYEVKVRARAGTAGQIALPSVAAQAGTLEAVLLQQVESVKGAPGTDETTATLLTEIKGGNVNAPGARGSLSQVGQASRSSRTAEGQVTPLPSPAADIAIALGNLCLEFPPDPVKVGDSWSAPMTVLPLLRSSAVARVPAEHKVEGARWEQGYEALRIVSRFKVAALPVNVQGMSLYDVSGTRTTWFAYKEHLLLRMEDHLEGIFRQQQAQAQTPALRARSTPQPATGIRRRGETTVREDLLDVLSRMGISPSQQPQVPQPQQPTQPTQPTQPAAQPAAQPSPALRYTLDLVQVMQR